MVAIAPGSPVQLFVALMICLAYLLLVLHAAPFKGGLEDRLAFLVSLCLTVSFALGFAIITDGDDEENVFDPELMGILLILLNVVPLAYGLFALVNVVRFGPNYGIFVQSATAVAVGRKLPRKFNALRSSVAKAVTKHKVQQIELASNQYRVARTTKMKGSEARASARLQARLAQRATARVEIAQCN